MEMEGADRLNELTDKMLVSNIMSRLDCTTKELIRTTATISKRWKNLWTQLPRLIFSYEYGCIDYFTIQEDLNRYISFIDNTINKCPTDLNLKKFKLDMCVTNEFKSRANRWIRYAISRNVEEVDLRLSDVVVGPFSYGYDLWKVPLGLEFTYEDELFFNTSCITRMTLSFCRFNPPSGAISWETLEYLCLLRANLDEDMIEKILSGSPCLESLELNDCYGYRRIDITSKSVKKLVFSGYNSHHGIEAYDEAYIDCVKIDAPYISSLTIKGELVLREFVLLNVSSLVETHLDYSMKSWRFDKEVLRGLLKSLGHVEDITFGDHCSKLVMEGVDRLNELTDDMLVTNIMSRLDCTTKELIRTTATISKRWKNLWTRLPRLIFSYHDGHTYFEGDDTHLCDYISIIDNTLNQCPANLNLKKFKLYIHYNSKINSEFKSQANSWIRYAISRNVEDVDLDLWDTISQGFTFEDELFFNTSCTTRMSLLSCLFNPPNGVIRWERLECLCLTYVMLDEDMIEKILSGSPCLESLELKKCHGYKRIDVTSRSVKKLLFSDYYYRDEYVADYFDCIEINAPFISSLTINGYFEVDFVLLDVSSLIKAQLDYSIDPRMYDDISSEEMIRGLLESLDHVKDVILNDFCWEFYSNLKARGDTSKVVMRC